MASYANGVIPKNNVSITDVRQTLGLSNTQQWNSVGYLCVSNKVNKWSRFKPISVPKDVLTDVDRVSTSGFETIPYPSGDMGSLPVLLKHKPPTGGAASPYRLGDFRGYKHKAVAPSIRVDDIFIGGADFDKPATFNAIVQLPDIPLGQLMNGANRISIVRTSQYTDSPLGVEVVGTLNLSLTDGGVALAGTKVTVACSQTGNIPSNGRSTNNRYIAKVNDYFFDLVSVVSDYATITKQFIVDPSDPTQWQDCNIEDPENFVDRGACRWAKWEYFYGDGDREDTRIRITDLYATQTFQIKMEYYNVYTSQWYFYGYLSSGDKDFIIKAKHISRWRLSSRLTKLETSRVKRD